MKQYSPKGELGGYDTDSLRMQVPKACVELLCYGNRGMTKVNKAE